MGRHGAWKGVGMGQDGKLVLSVQRHYKSKSVIIPVGVILFKDLFLLSTYGCFLPHTFLYITCTQCPWRPEEGLEFSGLGVIAS